MVHRITGAALAVAFVMAPAVAHAAETLQVVSGPNGARGVQIAAFGPLGQSFTATAADLTSFGLQFQTFNAGAAAAPVIWSLRAGDGLGGAVIATRTLNLPTTLPSRSAQFYDFDITGTSVVAGQRYTAVVSTATTRYGLALGPEVNIFTGQFLGGDAYAGGQAYFSRTPFANCTNTAVSNCDLNFRVTGDNAAALPEPGTWALMIAGFGLAGWAMRRSSRVALA